MTGEGADPRLPPVVRPAARADARAIADVYLASRRDALPYLPVVHGEAETRAWIREVVTPRPGTWVALVGDRIVGFLSLVDDDLDQLYLAPGYYRRGIGSALLEIAKRLSPSGLHLYAFQRNERARAFYEAQGFTVFDLNDGARNEEGEPDVRYEWRGALTRRPAAGSGGQG